MTNHAAKLFFGVAAFGAAAALGYQWVVGDRAGSLLFLGLAFVAVLVGLSVQGAIGRDWAPRIEADAPADRRPVDARDVARPSPWPLISALAAAGVVIGTAYGATWLMLGLLLATIPAVAWLAQTWREYVGWTPRMGERLAQRLIAPFVTPVGTFLIAIFVAISLSRTLLAVNETASWVTALIVAAAMLGILAYVATRPRVSQGLVFGLAGAGVLAAVGVGVVGAAAGEREFEVHEDHTSTQRIVAENIAFDDQKLIYPSKTQAVLEFDNLDEGVFHNVAFYTRKDKGEPLFNGKPIPSGDINYSFKTPEKPGTYYFVCDFHPNMEGDLVVTEAGEHEGDKVEADEHGEDDSYKESGE